MNEDTVAYVLLVVLLLLPLGVGGVATWKYYAERRYLKKHNINNRLQEVKDWEI